MQFYVLWMDTHTLKLDIWEYTARNRFPLSAAASTNEDAGATPETEPTTPPLPQRKPYVEQLPDLVGADDDESDDEEKELDSCLGDDDDSNDGPTQHIDDSTTDEAELATAQPSPSDDHPVENDHAMYKVSAQQCAELPFYLRGQMTVDDVNGYLANIQGE
jgi:hypothetical protein